MYIYTLYNIIVKYCLITRWGPNTKRELNSFIPLSLYIYRSKKTRETIYSKDLHTIATGISRIQNFVRIVPGFRFQMTGEKLVECRICWSSISWSLTVPKAFFRSICKYLDKATPIFNEASCLQRLLWHAREDGNIGKLPILTREEAAVIKQVFKHGTRQTYQTRMLQFTCTLPQYGFCYN